ncbi:uncharacterized protein LOC136078212 [Hydra vulgaris]|uniref:Uncharacterized protein LOC136078212 n=1 Tax=Hydra vulgaris TaxID=6087 RepID=A0ABM4BKE1_HYDVU
MANATANVLTEYNSAQSLIAVIVDNTTSNTGADNGLVIKLEKILKRSLHLLGCLLHQVEHPLRHIICELDGSTNGPKSYKGLIGDAASHQTLHKQLLVEFVPIYSEIELFVRSEVISDLTADQRKLYEYCVGISKGFISKKFLSKQPGPIFHARWLTLALRIMMVYVRTNKPSSELLVITKYIVQVYCVMWFAIKRSGKYKDAC